MKKSAPLILSFMLGISAINTTTVSADRDESEYANHWGYKAIVYGIEQGYVNGNEKGEILPDKNITRAEFATILVGALKLSSTTNQTVIFSDVKEADWFYKYIQIATQHELIFGYDGKFRPNDLITREEMASILARAAKKINYPTATVPLTFNDTSKIANWAKNDIQQLLSLGVMSGYTDNTFGPKGNSKRVEVFSSIMRFLTIDANNPIKYGRQITNMNYTTDFTKALTTQASRSPQVANKHGFFNARKEVVAYYMHPQSFDSSDYRFYQFLKTDSVVENIDVNAINTKEFNDENSTLFNSASYFVEAGKELGINALYLMAHAKHETKNGTSDLALGVAVGVDANKKATMVTTENRASLKDIKLTYNMYGIQAIDGMATKTGAEYAYQKGWFTPELAIKDGAEWIKNRYIDNNQNTLYKMRWSPSNPGTRQYATNVFWAINQAQVISNLYELIGGESKHLLEFEVPYYTNQPIASTIPSKETWYSIGPKNAGKKGIIANAANVNFRKWPEQVNESLHAEPFNTLPLNTEVLINGENNNWYNVTTAEGQTGWISGEYLIIK